ncbi:uncharacterized protein LOC112591179 [Melanaphis sacchari]|uniref:uncharacterized protein LOC112591179 n=1 Tax=Melanaphis sacchari TaxID=742174 RepID=UPI000DC1517E|nr:uncharacterized protein LOC112591179 [Melanaphis sacchari]
MRRPTTIRLLLAVATMLLSDTLLETVAAERQRDTTDENEGGDNFYEFEEKILRAWLEKYIDKYKKYNQLPTRSTNIQRIAKKSETNNFKMPMSDHEHVVALSMFPFLVNPFYQPSIYSHYIPLTYDATTRLIPVEQIPYQKEEFHHRFLGPLQTQFPIGYNNFHKFMSSTLINNEPEIKETMNAPNFIPPSNQEVIKKYDNELHIPEQISNQNQDDFNHTSPIGLDPEEPKVIDQKKVNISEQQNSKNDRKLLDQIVVDNLPNTVTVDQNQVSESHEIQDLQPTTTTDDSNTSMTLNTYNLTETYQTSTVPSLNISNKTSKSKIYSNSISQLLLNSDYNLLKHINSSDHPTTREPSFMSNVKQLETSVKSTFSSTTDDKNLEVTLTSKERSRPDESQKFHYYSKDKYITGILKAPIINIGETLTETTRTTQNTKFVNTFSMPQSTSKITLFSNPLCENNDCKITTFSLINTPLAKLDKNNKLNIVSDLKNYESFDQKFTKIINGQHNVTDLNSSSTRPSTIPIMISETSTMPFTKTYSTNISTSSQPHPKYFSSTISPRTKYITDKNNKIQPTSLRYTSLLLPMLQPLNINNIKTSVLVETKTEQTPPITTNSNKCTNCIKQNTNMLRHHDDSTISSSTSPDINMYSNNYQSQKIPTVTKKLNTHKDDNIDTSYLSVTTEGTKRSTFIPTVTPLKQYNTVQKKLPFITISDDSKFSKTTYNQETLNTPRSIEDSELWYNQMYPQTPSKKEPNDEQIHYLLKKIVKLLKPEIEKQTLTKESAARLVPPRLGDPEKFVYIIYPWIIDAAAKNMENEKQIKTNTNIFKTSDKLK